MATNDMPMTVTQANGVNMETGETVIPLRVIADGADVDCPAATTDTTLYAVGDRVQATVRTPQRPLVTGKVDTS